MERGNVSVRTDLRALIRWTRDVVLIALLIFGARSVVADWNHIPSGSMKPTLLEGDLILVNRLAYDLKFPFTTWHLSRWAEPGRGEIVVFDSPADGRLLVKRIIGVPGDTIEMRQNALWVNGEAVPYGPPDGRWVAALSDVERQGYAFAAERLPEGEHAVMLSLAHSTVPTFGPVQVPAGNYLMLGDNRDNSADSRFFGLVSRADIKGRASRVILSLDPDHYYLPRAERFFDQLL